ncbi:MAG: amino acid permease [Enterobacteriaceae bacterium]
MKEKGSYKNLKIRHLKMLAIGSSIGTGLFINFGFIIFKAGILMSIFLCFLIVIITYFLMINLYEMSLYDIKYNSFFSYGTEFVNKEFGFALGWNYWWNWSITTSINLIAIQMIIKYWFIYPPGWVWSLLFLFLFILFNAISNKIFGEIEYLLSLIKIFFVFLFIILGIYFILNKIIYENKTPIIENLLFKDFYSTLNVIPSISFCFQGIELFGISLKDYKNYDKNIFLILTKIIFKIFFLYVFSILVIGLILSKYDLNNLYYNKQNVINSPFTIVLYKINFIGFSSIVNFVILMSVFSSGNYSIYASTRILYILSKESKAPKIFSKISRNGVPYFSLLCNVIISMLFFLYFLYKENLIYVWLINLSSITGIVAWLCISISYLFYMKKSSDFKFYNLKTIFTFISIFFCLFIIIVQNYIEFYINYNINLFKFISINGGILLFIAYWMYYYLKKKFLNSFKHFF